VLQENIAFCSTFPWSIFQIQVNPCTYAWIAGKEYMHHALYNGQARLKKPVEVILSPYDGWSNGGCKFQR